MALSPQVLHDIPKKKDGVWGVATLGDELFVVRDESSSVDVYRVSDFVESRQISVPGMKDLVSPRRLSTQQLPLCK